MIDLRDMSIMTALARHRHFARAAAEAGMSQPAFSARIAKIEANLGVRVVYRGNRFEGFTDEGELVLRWSRRILRDAECMAQELRAIHGPLKGRVTLGVVPTALSHVALAPARLHARHPDLGLSIMSASSDVILRGLADHSLSAGITYIGGDIDPKFKTIPLYDERYVVLCPVEIAPRATDTMSWAEAARLPLCLLTPDMQNRQRIDAIFSDLGARPNIVLETNAFTAAIAQLHTGLAATIVPESMVRSLPAQARVRTLKLRAPEVSNAIGVVLPDYDPIPPNLAAALDALKSVAS